MAKKKRKPRLWPPVPAPLAGPVTDNHTHLPVVKGLPSGGGSPADGELLAGGELLADAELLAGGEAAASTLPQEGAGSAGVVVDSDDPGAPPTQDTGPLSTAEQLRRAAQAGIHRVITCGCELPTLEGAVELARENPRIWAAIAIHPNEAPLHAGTHETGPDGLEARTRPHHRIGLDEAIAQVDRLAADPRVIAIGETGLDYFRTGPGGRAAQEYSFRAHIEIAKRRGLAMQIHDREAHDDVVEILESAGAPESTVFHCFSGGLELARKCAQHGWYASFAGPITYPANEELRRALLEIPRELVLVETDAPYLTAVPHRGQPNAPYLTGLTVREIARLWGVDEVTACGQLEANTQRAYGLPPA